MKTDNNFVRSGRERIPDDNYQTIDPRCITALLDILRAGNWITDDDTIIDCCSPQGSGILDEVSKTYRDVVGGVDAFMDFRATWIITNPPYERSKVDKIIFRQLDRLHNDEAYGLAVLVRTQFDHAKTRWNMFADNPLYAGQVKMLFRPIWFKDGDSTPIHNYVWHIWKNKIGYSDTPRVWYWKED